MYQPNSIHPKTLPPLLTTKQNKKDLQNRPLRHQPLPNLLRLMHLYREILDIINNLLQRLRREPR
jgi:hypothetical protein